MFKSEANVDTAIVLSILTWKAIQLINKMYKQWEQLLKGIGNLKNPQSIASKYTKFEFNYKIFWSINGLNHLKQLL